MTNSSSLQNTINGKGAAGKPKTIMEKVIEKSELVSNKDDERKTSIPTVVGEDSPGKRAKDKVGTTTIDPNEYKSPAKKIKTEKSISLDTASEIQGDKWPSWKIVRIGMRGSEGREAAGGEKSVPRKTRRVGVKLVIDENGGGLASLSKAEVKKSKKKSTPQCKPVTISKTKSDAKSVTDDDDSHAKEREIQEETKERSAAPSDGQASTVNWMKSMSLKVFNKLSFGFFASVSDAPIYKDFAVTHHAQFDPNDLPSKELCEEQDFNEYRLSGGAERDKNQPKESRAISLAVINTYDKLESLMSSIPGEKVYYGDLGENFLIDGPMSLADTVMKDTKNKQMVTNQLRVGMKLNLGTNGAMIEIRVVNNPCTRLGNVPWSERAKKFAGGMYVHPTKKKYGWWWSPKLPLYDETHPGGRGLLCRVLKEGEVYENDAVTVAQSDE